MKAGAIAQRANDRGYVRGLQRAAQFLAEYAAQPLPGFDQDTCRKLERGMRGMVESARQRLDVDEEGDQR